MNLAELREKYPDLLELLEILANDTNQVLNPEMNVPEFLYANLEAYSKQSSQLTRDEKEALACGEEEEQQEVVKATGFTALDSFLSEIFDGCLHGIFLVPATIAPPNSGAVY